MQDRLRLIKFFEHQLDNEVSKPVGEMNTRVIDAYVEVLLDLQEKHIELSTEFINEQVRKIFHSEDEPAPPEAVKTIKKHFNKKKIWLVAACISILIALFSFVCVANDWNVFDFLSEKFGSVHSAPVGEEQEFNGVSVFVYNNDKIYPTIEDALKYENIDILYPATLSEGIKVESLQFSKVNSLDEIVLSFNDAELFIGIYCDTPLSEAAKKDASEIQKINSLTCYICEMPDINACQISFEHKGDTYTFNHSNKGLLIEIIENLKEINNEN